MAATPLISAATRLGSSVFADRTTRGLRAMSGGLVVLLSLLTVAVAAPADARTPERDVPASVERLSVPAIGVDAGILPVGVTRAGSLAVGSSVRDVYRWRDGVRPGQPGSAVLAGHTWSEGDGVFDRLGALRPGHRVDVGRVRFEVTRVRRVTRMSPEAVARLFSDRGRPRLVLITCGDRDARTGVYRTRIIVRAERLPRR